MKETVHRSPQPIEVGSNGSTDAMDTLQLNARAIRAEAQRSARRRAALQEQARLAAEEQVRQQSARRRPRSTRPQQRNTFHQTSGFADAAGNGYTQNGYPPEGYTQNGYAPESYAQNGYAPEGYTQNGYPPADYPGDFTRRDYPAYGQRRSTGGTGSTGGFPRDPAGAPRRRAGYSQPRQSENPRTQRQGQRKARRARKPRKYGFFGGLIRFVLWGIIILFLLYSAIALFGIVSMSRPKQALERKYTDGSLVSPSVKNIVLIGTDARDPSTELGRSDTIMLISMNSKTGQIYLSSLLRDTYVEIPDYGNGKLNAAYAYGGPALLLDTIELNFDVHVDDYVLLTFGATARMIDAVGGVTLTLSDEEAQAVNEILISEVNGLMGDEREDDLLTGGGTLHLNGKQALSYSRIRYVGNADFERTERQRTVMTQVMQKARHNPLYLAAMCAWGVPKMGTNMSVGKLYGYSLTTPVKLLFYGINEQRLPPDDTFYGGFAGGESVVIINDWLEIDDTLLETVYDQAIAS